MSAVVTLVLELNSLKPYAPVHLIGGRQGNDIILQWTRRARVNNLLVPGTDIPLGEDGERYQINVYDTSDYASPGYTTTSDVQTLTLSAALQAANFGGFLPPGGCYFDVAQLGKTGYGSVARGVI